MRDLVAGIVALLLLLFAAGLAATLHLHRKRRLGAHLAEHAKGHAIIAELPVGPDLTLFSEDSDRFFYGGEAIDKSRIRAVRVLINGAPIAGYVSRRFPEAWHAPATAFEDPPEGIARDRWNVAVETIDDTVLVECGAIRERVSQELARKIFDAVKRDLEDRDRTG